MLKTHCLPKVREFREAVRLHQPDPATHRQLFEEEQQEFYDAETDAEVADALADMVVVWCGALIDTGKPIYRDDEWFWAYVQDQAAIAGIDLRGAFDLVHESNMSKLFTIKYAPATMERFSELGLAVDVRGIGATHYAAYSAYDQTGNDGKHYPAGKLLKPTTYHAPDWSKEGVWRL